MRLVQLLLAAVVLIVSGGASVAATRGLIEDGPSLSRPGKPASPAVKAAPPLAIAGISADTAVAEDSDDLTAAPERPDHIWGQRAAAQPCSHGRAPAAPLGDRRPATLVGTVVLTI